MNVYDIIIIIIGPRNTQHGQGQFINSKLQKLQWVRLVSAKGKYTIQKLIPKIKIITIFLNFYK